MRRGFTLLEMVTVIAIVAVALGVAVPSVARMQARRALRSTAQDLMGRVEQARSLARSRRTGYPGWPEDMVVKESGLRFVGGRKVEVYVDGDKQNDGAHEVVVSAAWFQPRIALASPVTQLRFRRNGTLTTTEDLDFVLRDRPTEQEITVSVAYGGQSRLEP